MNFSNYHVTILFVLFITTLTTPFSKMTVAQTSINASDLSDRTNKLQSESIPTLSNDLPIYLPNIEVNDTLEDLEKKNNSQYSLPARLKAIKVINNDNKLNSDLLFSKYIIQNHNLTEALANYLEIEDAFTIATQNINQGNEITNNYNQFLELQDIEYVIPSITGVKFTQKLILANIIPIEDEKIQPPRPPALEEDDDDPDITIPPVQIEQETEIEKTPENIPEIKRQQRNIILDSLTVSAIKYAWITNPTDNFTFAPQLFKPNENENYIDVDIRFARNNPIINKFTYGNFPEEDQFYWVLDNNRVVIKTIGSQGGIVYQGRGNDIQSLQRVTSSQAFWGLQAVFNIPVDFQRLDGELATTDNGTSIISIAGQIINPEGIPAGPVIINSGIDDSNPNVTVLKNVPGNIGSASTNSPDGGGDLFSNLDATNSPQILQGYPTTNLQPLLGEGEVALREGQIIPNNILESAGIFWGDILTGEGFNFTAPISSNPAIKIAQEGKFDNIDLLNLLVNPFLSQQQRDVHYLNSLLWLSLGRRDPQFRVLSEQERSYDWYRFFLSYPHNRTIIQYDPTEISATYTNIFANYGFSLTTSFKRGDIDTVQSINSTLGLLLGTIFENIKIDEIDEPLEAALEKFENGENFDTLQTTATATQRSQINQRLNRTLSYANSASGLEQVSGTYTFPGKITPENSTIFQIRTGNHKRAVQFVGRDVEIVQEGDTFFSDLQLSNQRFGPLTYIGVPVPLNQTGIQPINESSAVEVILTNPSGEQIVQRFSSTDNTSVPINARGADLAFDFMELTRIDDVKFNWNLFNGYLSLPTVEFLAAGTSGNFNYSASLGSWFNINANSAPGVGNNNLGLPEPTLGLYTNALVNYIKTNVELDAENQPIALNTHAPFFRIDWNSASNRNNPFSTFLSYYFERKERNLGYSISPGIAFIQDNSNGQLLGLLNGEFSTNQGLNLKARFEIGKEIFYTFEGLQRIDPRFSAGIYLRNYSVNNIGLSSRASGFNYGLIGRHNFQFNNVFLEAQVGTGANGFDLRIQGGYKF
ncbi:hypothetical protein [Nostoc sp. CCY0012]|uniref:hypothetical protein n=1 Tax=Nostoc sp. CCY0012 TaxID=1056123 RepID=UPI0039C6936B